MRDFRDYLISKESSIKEALVRLNELAADAILFVVDKNDRLLGSLTDGDVRRGLLKGLGLEKDINEFIQKHPRYIRKDQYSIGDIIKLREENFEIVPVLDKKHQVVNIINFRYLTSYLPIDAVIMAGGRGSRLRPMTDKVPKPLLKVGSKPIIEHNLDRLIRYGVDDFWISVRYLGAQIENYFHDGSSKGVKIEYIWEDKPLGTIGAVSKIIDFQHDYILVTNSDILTTLDYEDFFLDFLQKNAEMSVVTIPYSVNIPYAVLETTNDCVISFKEKPTYTYYSNGGIYLIKRDILKYLPYNTFYDTTDLMQYLIEKNMKLISYPMRQYWLDIGKHEDFEKAQADIKHLIL